MSSSNGVGLFYSIHSSELLYTADTGNDYIQLSSRREKRWSRVQGCLSCSVLFFVLLRHVMLLCPRDISYSYNTGTRDVWHILH